MYLRAIHAEFDIPTLRRFIRDNPLGILISAFPSSNFPTIQCSHIPWILDVKDEQSDSELGHLRGHMARANPQSKNFVEMVQANASPSNNSLSQEVSVLFNGPALSYVTPKFYVETKPATGKVVPTWNYSAVQAYGKATIHWDYHSETTNGYLQKQIEDLTRHSEETVANHSSDDAWEVSDAPTPFIELIRKNIVGIEINIERLEGKWKMSQEMGQGDREGVVEGFESLETDVGCKMAQTVRERGAKKDKEKQSKI